MPKAKTHSGTKDRFRVTRSGKVLHKRRNTNHLMEAKSGSRARRLSRANVLGGNDAKNVKKLLNGN